MDAGAGAQAYRAAIRGAVQSLAGMAHPAQARLELPATERASTGARRAGDPALETGSVAAH